MIYQQGYDELLGICKQITSHRQKLAKPKVDEVVCKHIDLDITNENLLSHLIGESLLKRIDRKLLESKNIYVQQFDIPQIQLFYSMSEAIPLVAAGHALANQYIHPVIRDLKKAVVIDIGIGKGRQMLNLLDMVEVDRGRLESLLIIGIDPDEKNLLDTEAKLRERKLPIPLHFQPICGMIEDLTENDYREIKSLGGKNICINSAFSLHHSSHPLNDTELRTNLLRRFASLKPLVLTLVEPNSDHDTEDLPKRFHHSWEHFGHVFKLIDASSIDDTHKFSIKVKFFGREIRDIFGVSDHFRSERHELYESWLLRLSRAGFKPLDYQDFQVSLPDYVSSSVSEGLVRLNFEDVTVVSVMGYILK